MQLLPHETAAVLGLQVWRQIAQVLVLQLAP